MKTLSHNASLNFQSNVKKVLKIISILFTLSVNDVGVFLPSDDFTFERLFSFPPENVETNIVQ